MNLEGGQTGAPCVGYVTATMIGEVERALAANSAFLRFSPAIERRFEDETKRDRIRHVRRMTTASDG